MDKAKIIDKAKSKDKAKRHGTDSTFETKELLHKNRRNTRFKTRINTKFKNTRFYLRLNQLVPIRKKLVENRSWRNHFNSTGC